MDRVLFDANAEVISSEKEFPELRSHHQQGLRIGQWSDLQYKQALLDNQRNYYFPESRKAISYLPSDFLRSGLFGLSTTISDEDIVQSFPIYRWDSVDAAVPGEFIHYSGPRLTQFHKRVLLQIVVLAAGAENTAELCLELGSFLVSIGRSPCTRNRVALARALGHLASVKGRITKYEGDRGTPFTFLGGLTWVKGSANLLMSPSFARMLWWSRRTLLPLAMRTPLPDGVATALMDLFRAAPQPMYGVKALADIWQREPVQFGRELSGALNRLVDVGFLSGYQRSRGKVHVDVAEYKYYGSYT